MKSKQAAKKSFISKLLIKYRLVLLDESTFEERISFKTSRINVFVLMTTTVFLIALITSTIIFFTPVREYIPGYSSINLQKQANSLNQKTDSLLEIVFLNDQYINSLKQVLTGELKAINYNQDSIKKVEEENLQLINKSREDSILRVEVEIEDKYNLKNIIKEKKYYLLAAPLKGNITHEYSGAENHLAIDVAADTGTAVKSISDGVVLFSEWTTQTGYVIIIDHGDDLTSVYKHNQKLLKKQGDKVKLGEVIATSGDTGTLTSGPHLHFELWSEGFAIDPKTLIDFN
jgi:murein DD-endopeptidase MepM/ murein hydrolase activator NlpD